MESLALRVNLFFCFFVFYSVEQLQQKRDTTQVGGQGTNLRCGDVGNIGPSLLLQQADMGLPYLLK